MNYKEIVETILNVSSGHTQVNYTSYGVEMDISNIHKSLFPIVYLQPSDTSIDATYIYYTFNIFCLDQLSTGNLNGLTLFSECLKILIDIIYTIDNNYFSVVYNTDITPTFENYDQKLRGWMATMQIKIPFDGCAIII